MVSPSDEKKFIFWQQWLFYTSVIFAIAGILFACFGNSILFRPYEKLLANVFWQSNAIPAEVQPFKAFMYGPLGGTISCCYILCAYIVYYPFKEKKRWARNAIIVAFGIWVVVDSVASYKYGMYPQIYIINTFSILAKALPIYFTWKDFEKVN